MIPYGIILTINNRTGSIYLIDYLGIESQNNI